MALLGAELLVEQGRERLGRQERGELEPSGRGVERGEEGCHPPARSDSKWRSGGRPGCGGAWSVEDREHLSGRRGRELQEELDRAEAESWPCRSDRPPWTARRPPRNTRRKADRRATPEGREPPEASARTPAKRIVEPPPRVKVEPTRPCHSAISAVGERELARGRAFRPAVRAFISDRSADRRGGGRRRSSDRAAARDHDVASGKPYGGLRLIHRLSPSEACRRWPSSRRRPPHEEETIRKVAAAEQRFALERDGRASDGGTRQRPALNSPRG